MGMPEKKASTMGATTYHLRRHFIMSLRMPIEVPHDWGIYHAMFIAFCLHVVMGAESFFLWFRIPSSLLVCNISCMITHFFPSSASVAIL